MLMLASLVTLFAAYGLLADLGLLVSNSIANEPDLILDASDLSSVYLGAFGFADLARAGRVRECRPDMIAATDRIFASDMAPWCSTMF